ncbi:MAG: redoxin family protein [Armatimonadota bacterium]
MPLKYKNHLGVSTAVIAALSLSAVAGLAIPKSAPVADDAAKTAAPTTANPTAQDVLAKMAAKYSGLKSYSSDISFAIKNPQNSMEFTSKVAYKSGKAAVTITSPEGTSKRIFDGKTLFATKSSDPKTYQKLSPQSSMEGVQEALRQADIGLLALLLMDPNVGDKVLPSNATSTTVDPKGDTVDGVAVDVVTAVMGEGKGSFRFNVGKEDGLLRRITISQAKDGVEVGSLTTTYRNIKVNPVLQDSQFVFKPAPGQTAQAAPKQPQNFDPRLKKGAKPLPFASVDTARKPISLAQYKGKVVLVDFWATWCGPCIAELPNVVSAYSKYKTKGFDVIGVSLDDAGATPKLASFAKANNMSWRQVLDADNPKQLASAYGVTAIPFTVLIGKDGTIAAVNLRGEELETAVAAALAK